MTSAPQPAAASAAVTSSSTSIFMPQATLAHGRGSAPQETRLRRVAGGTTPAHPRSAEAPHVKCNPSITHLGGRGTIRFSAPCPHDKRKPSEQHLTSADRCSRPVASLAADSGPSSHSAVQALRMHMTHALAWPTGLENLPSALADLPGRPAGHSQAPGAGTPSSVAQVASIAWNLTRVACRRSWQAPWTLRVTACPSCARR